MINVRSGLGDDIAFLCDNGEVNLFDCYISLFCSGRDEME